MKHTGINPHQGLWYAWRIRPGMEAKAHEALTQADIQSLFVHQTTEVKRRTANNRREVHAIRQHPLLTGYALACNETEPQPYWEMRIRSLTCYGGPSIGHVPVVRGLLGPVVAGVAALDHLMAYGGKVDPPEPRRLRPGDAARITAGPLACSTPVVIEAVDKGRARVVLGSLVVSMPLNALEAA